MGCRNAAEGVGSPTREDNSALPGLAVSSVPSGSPVSPGVQQEGREVVSWWLCLSLPWGERGKPNFMSLAVCLTNQLV